MYSYSSHHRCSQRHLTAFGFSSVATHTAYDAGEGRAKTQEQQEGTACALAHRITDWFGVEVVYNDGGVVRGVCGVRGVVCGVCCVEGVRCVEDVCYVCAVHDLNDCVCHRFFSSVESVW